VIFRPPGGRPLPPAEPVKRGGLFFAELPVAERPGFYEVRTDPPGPVLTAAVNVAPQESRVQPLTGTALTDALQGLNVRLVLEGEGVEAVVRDSRLGRDLWKQFLIAAVLVLVLEGLLAKWFTRAAARKEEGSPA
jgi:hypothetical protein